MTRVAVLGGSNGALATVVELTLAGHEVHWWRREESSFPPGGTITYEGLLGEGTLRPATWTADLARAVTGAEVVLAPLPATAQEELIPRLAPHLAEGQVVAFLPGTFGSWVGAGARPDVVFMETATLPYLARQKAPGHVAVPVTAARLPVGALPGEGAEADRAHALFAGLYPAAVRLPDALSVALANWGTILHPPVVLHNLGAIETLGENFDVHSEGTSDGVRRSILALDAERIALREALGIPGEHWPISTHYDRSPLSMYGPEAKDRLVASGLFRESLHLEHRYVTEDIVLGLVLLASLGRLAGVDMPVSEALLALSGPSLGIDPFATGRTVASLGIDDLDELRRRVQHGLG